MFLLALNRYRERVVRFASQATESEDPMGALRDYFLAIARGLARQEDYRGCLITNTMIELAPHDDEIREQLKANYEVQVEIFRKSLANAQSQGQLDKHAEVRQLARYLVQQLEGMRVTSKSNPGEKYLEDNAICALSLLPLTAKARQRRPKRTAGSSKAAKRARKV